MRYYWKVLLFLALSLLVPSESLRIIGYVLVRALRRADPRYAGKSIVLTTYMSVCRPYRVLSEGKSGDLWRKTSENRGRIAEMQLELRYSAHSRHKLSSPQVFSVFLQKTSAFDVIVTSVSLPFFRGCYGGALLP